MARTIKTEQLAPNQIVIFENDKNKYGLRVFQSYNSIIAVYDLDDGSLTLGHDWDYSKTTVRWLLKFLNDWTNFTGYNSANIRKAIESGTIKYDPEMR